jgi:uncharacterized protein
MFVSEVQQSLRSFMFRVNAWMAAGLLITGLTGYIIFQEQAFFYKILKSPLAFFVLFIAQLALVVLISGWIRRMSFATAALAFILYSVLSGVTLSVIFFIYEIGSIAVVFGITTAMFAIMAIYGYITKTDLTSLGSFLLMGLMGLIIASLINLFLNSNTFNYIISFLGVLIFVGLTAYDVQKIKAVGQELIYQGENVNKIALLGALTLYLDFLNLFIYLLSLLGKKRR